VTYPLADMSALIICSMSDTAIQSGFPTVTGLHNVVSCDVAPRDERNENDDPETGLDILSSCGGDLVSGPQGQSERKKVDCLPDKLEEQQWEHLHGIA
jgi:hypothetical protein